MSLSKLGFILLSGFLIFATAPTAPAQNTQSPKGEKQTGTPQQGQATQDQKKTTEKKTTEKKATEKKDDSQTTEKKATAKKAKTGKKTSGVQSKETVREVQTALKNHGLDPGPIDGAMGPKTMDALRDFQSQNNLPATGKLDEKTEVALGVHATRSTPTSHLDTGEIRQIQQALNERDYYYGDINGTMNPETRQAVKEFQLLNYMPATGVVTEKVIVALGVSPVDTEQAQTSEKSVDQEEAARYKPGVDVGEGKVAGAETQSDSQRKTSDQGAYKYDNGRNTDKNHATASTGTVDKANKEAADRIQKSVEVLQALTSAGDKGISNEALERAQAIAVIPHVVKGALGIGGRFGKGVVAQRLPDGRWSAPAFIQIGGGSFGAQIGVSATDLVLVFTDKKGLDLLMKGKDLKLGVDASVAAGPIGRSAEAGVNANLETGILAYSRSKGLFAGIALDGAVLDIDNDMNKKAYGGSVSAEDILNGRVRPSPVVMPFTDTVSRIIPRKAG